MEAPVRAHYIAFKIRPAVRSVARSTRVPPWSCGIASNRPIASCATLAASTSPAANAAASPSAKLATSAARGCVPEASARRPVTPPTGEVAPLAAAVACGPVRVPCRSA